MILNVTIDVAENIYFAISWEIYVQVWLHLYMFLILKNNINPLKWQVLKSLCKIHQTKGMNTIQVKI